METTLYIFIGLSLVNVILSTIKSIWTINANRLVASLINAISYAFNAIVIKQIVGFDTMITIYVVLGTNLVGVYAAKWITDKMRKDRLWEVHATISGNIENAKALNLLNESGLPYTQAKVIRKGNECFSYNIFCETQKDSTMTKSILQKCNAKYTVVETESL